MIAFDTRRRSSRCRAADVIEHAGAILLHRSVPEDFRAPPGGRVELGEHAGATIVRKPQEELGEIIRCGELLYVVENVFHYSGRHHHEIGLYFRTQPTETSLLADRSQPFFGLEAGARLEYAWFARSRIPDMDVRPALLRPDLMGTPGPAA